MADVDKDQLTDKSSASDTSASDNASDRLQDAARGATASSSAAQTAQNLTGNRLLEDVMAWQEQITALPQQTDKEGNLVKFQTDKWTDEHFEKANQLHQQIPKRLKVYGAKAQLTNKDLGQSVTMMDLEDKMQNPQGS
ncbi:MAG TPA: hypothetical protein V6C97_28690 [Oculatellaceae cyanobacterium]